MHRPRLINALTAFALVLAPAWLVATPALAAQPQTIEAPTREAAREELKKLRLKEFHAAFNVKDFTGAAAALEDLVILDPGEPIVAINLATTRAVLGEDDAAEAALLRALENGYDDLHQLKANKALVDVLKRERMAAILASPERLLAASRDVRVSRLARDYAPRAGVSLDVELRLAVLSSLPPGSLRTAQIEMRAVARWWMNNVLSAEADSAIPAEKAKRLVLDPTPQAWTVVFLPTREQYNTWLVQTTGVRPGSLAGLYDHDKRQLVTQDTGATLRHEFAHVLHWRHCTALGQNHPVWVQEGLCSLIEDVARDTVDGGGDDALPTLRPVPSWRTNTVRNMARNGVLPPWSKLFAKDSDVFMKSTPLANYAVARAIFLWLHDTGQLRAWYANYTLTFAADASGMQAFEATFLEPIEVVEKKFRAWARNLPEAPDATRPGLISLPMEFAEQTGDGLTVTRILPGFFKIDGLRLGDVITAIDGAPIRDLHDYERAVSGRPAGSALAVSFRRGPGAKARTGVANVPLIAVEGR